MIHIGEPPRRHNPTGPAVEKEIPSTDHLGINTELLCMHKHDCISAPTLIAIATPREPIRKSASRQGTRARRDARSVQRGFNIIGYLD
jgi:hypothetical protein